MSRRDWTLATSSKEAFWELRYYVAEMSEALERSRKQEAADIAKAFASDDGLDDIAVDLAETDHRYGRTDLLGG